MKIALLFCLSIYSQSGVRWLLGLHDTFLCVLMSDFCRPVTYCSAYNYAECFLKIAYGKINSIILLYLLVAVSIDKLANDLRTDYKETRQKSQDEVWPPNQPSSIVSVALIHYGSTRTQQELIEVTKRFKEGAPAIDELVSSHSRVTKDIKKIFTADPINPSITPKRILIEGAPGIGKTVLAKEIAFCWANDELLKDCKLVLFVYLRDPRIHKVKSIDDLFEMFAFEKMPLGLKQYISHYNMGKNIAFVFDGFDEYPSFMQRNSLITDIIEGKNDGRIFQHSIVVITSRPSATLFLHGKVDRRIEILGFAKEERDKYITLSVNNSPSKKQEMDKYLKLHPIINSLCFIPLHLAILVFLFKMDSLPQTLTEMNEFFVVHTVYRQLNKIATSNKDVVKKLTDIQGIRADVYKFLKRLSKLAFQGLQKNQLVFSYDEIKEVCPEVDNMQGAIDGFGLLQAVQHYIQKGAGRTTSFNFLHFTMQEYLAAFHVSTLSDEQQLLLMNKTFWKGQYMFMWMMYVGIVGIKSSSFVSFLSTYENEFNSRDDGVGPSQSTINNKIRCLYLFQCYTEAKSDELPENISSLFNGGDIVLTGITLLPHHISSLIFFMSASIMQQWKNLSLGCCNLRSIGMNSLMEHIIKNEENISTLEYVDLSGNDSSPWGIYCAIIKHGSVNNLTVCGDEGMKGHIKEITDSLEANRKLESLTLCSIGRVGLASIKEVLVSNTTLNTVNLSWQKISP